MAKKKNLKKLLKDIQDLNNLPHEDPCPLCPILQQAELVRLDFDWTPQDLDYDPDFW